MLKSGRELKVKIQHLQPLYNKKEKHQAVSNHSEIEIFMQLEAKIKEHEFLQCGEVF